MNKMSIVELPPNDPVKEVRSKASTSLVVTQNGKAYYWPLYFNSGEIVLKPLEIVLPQKLQVATIACGYNFSVLVAKNGLVFTYGKENNFGQLGHGDLYPRENPTLIVSLKNEGAKVTIVACGYKHVICKTAIGKVYTWGWGEKGQLGHGNYHNIHAPKMLVLPNVANALGTKIKTIQVEAGFKHSMMFLESKKIVWFGSNGSIEDQCVPTEINLALKVIINQLIIF